MPKMRRFYPYRQMPAAEYTETLVFLLGKVPGDTRSAAEHCCAENWGGMPKAATEAQQDLRSSESEDPYPPLVGLDNHPKAMRNEIDPGSVPCTKNGANRFLTILQL